jgi:hypothetical protein
MNASISARSPIFTAAFLVLAASCAAAGEARIEVRADRVIHRLSPYLTGACIEDVNHEIYGGIYTQMVFGESFQEPAPPLPLAGFTAHEGRWVPGEDGLRAAGGPGPKLVCDGPEIADGAAGVDVLLPGRAGGNAGLILKVSDAGKGADRFTGYEVSLDGSGALVLGRHRQNWEPIRNVPIEVAPDRWYALAVRMKGAGLEVLVDGRSILQYEDLDGALAKGRVGIRTWQRDARFRNFWIDDGGGARKIDFRPGAGAWGDGVSGMWRPLRRGSAEGSFSLSTREPFAGRQSQTVAFARGEGEWGIENAGLNRQGMGFVAGKPFEGHFWARAEASAEAAVALETRDGARTLARARIKIPAGGWRRIDFALTPDAGEGSGRLAITLVRPGSVDIGHVHFAPGAWRRFKGLPDRRDVAEGLIDEGLTVLRYGGSMVNHPEYRWKKMIGPRDRRPPYTGTWYPYSSNGWGIIDFLDLCEAAGFLGIPAFNMGESPQDMADFLDYVNEPADGEWGRRRAGDGHPAPYRLRILELGNEERVDDAYFEKFRPIAEALWAKDRELILVVGDFAYGQPIEDPSRFGGAASRITSLDAQRKILDLARERGREVWFDVHVWTDGPGASNDLRALPSFVKALGKVAGGARYKVVVFEFNAGNHAQRRALGNALAIHAIERIGDFLPIACSANCLQVDGQNDNDWDQGLLFLNPLKVWLQPPGYVTRMVSRSRQPLLVEAEAAGAGPLDVNAKRSEDGKILILAAVNPGNEAVTAEIRISGFVLLRPDAIVEELSAPYDAVNTADAPDRVRPKTSEWTHGLPGGPRGYTFPPRSYTILRFE